MRLKSFNLLKAFSITHAPCIGRMLALSGCNLQLRLGMTGLVPRLQLLAKLGSILGLIAEHMFGRLYFADKGHQHSTALRWLPSIRDPT